IQDDNVSQAIKQGAAQDVVASNGERFSYSYRISSNSASPQGSCDYENHTQQGKFSLHSLAWVGFSNSNSARERNDEYDTVTFTGFGIWSKDGSRTVQQVSA